MTYSSPLRRSKPSAVSRTVLPTKDEDLEKMQQTLRTLKAKAEEKRETETLETLRKQHEKSLRTTGQKDANYEEALDQALQRAKERLKELRRLKEFRTKGEDLKVLIPAGWLQPRPKEILLLLSEEELVRLNHIVISYERHMSIARNKPTAVKCDDGRSLSEYLRWCAAECGVPVDFTPLPPPSPNHTTITEAMRRTRSKSSDDTSDHLEG